MRADSVMGNGQGIMRSAQNNIMSKAVLREGRPRNADDSDGKTIMTSGWQNLHVA